MTHAARALQSHDLSGEGIKLWITYILFWSRATSETAQTWKTVHTKHTHSRPYKANMKWWLRRSNDSRGPYGPKVSWHVLQVRKNPEKTSPRKPVPTGDRTRARCVTSAHATTCSTAVDLLTIIYFLVFLFLIRNRYITYISITFNNRIIQNGSKIIPRFEPAVVKHLCYVSGILILFLLS